MTHYNNGYDHSGNHIMNYDEGYGQKVQLPSQHGITSNSDGSSIAGVNSFIGLSAGVQKECNASGEFPCMLDGKVTLGTESALSSCMTHKKGSKKDLFHECQKQSCRKPNGEDSL